MAEKELAVGALLNGGRWSSSDAGEGGRAGED
jgi:hypothetical protein